MNQTVAKNLLDEALGLEEEEEDGKKSRVFLIKDCVETSGDFLLHHLMKRSLSPEGSVALIFVALSHPFSHYDRILRKLGCNLIMQRDSSRFVFLDTLKLRCPDGEGANASDGGLIELYGRIQEAIDSSALMGKEMRRITIMIDDISLLEIAARGSVNHVLNFVHYCRTLTSEMDCSLVMLNHEDIYLSEGCSGLMLPIEYLADVVIKVEPLATGCSADVHGQLTVLKKNSTCKPSHAACNFRYKVRENNVQCFYPGAGA